MHFKCISKQSLVTEIPQQSSCVQLNNILLYLAQRDLQPQPFLHPPPGAAGSILIPFYVAVEPFFSLHRLQNHLPTDAVKSWITLGFRILAAHLNSFPGGIDLGPPHFTFQTATVYLQYLISRSEHWSSRSLMWHKETTVPCYGRLQSLTYLCSTVSSLRPTAKGNNTGPLQS